MSRRAIFSGGPYEAAIGYARAVVDAGWIFVSGCTGAGADGMMPAEPARQCANALATIERALSEAGAGFADVVRVRYILPDRRDFAECWPLLKARFGAVPPAATMIEAGLIDPAMRIEIEVTARRP